MSREPTSGADALSLRRFGRGRRHISTIFVVCVSISAFFVVLFTALMTASCRHALPYWDQWDNLIAGRPITWTWLVSQHNEHRILFPRLIYLCDAWFFNERNNLELVANISLQLATASIVTVLGTQLIRPGWRGSVVVASVTVTMMFSAVQWENMASPFQVQFFLVCFAAVACIVIFVKEKPHRLVSIPVTILQTLAVFSLASGILVPVVTTVLALWLRRPKLQVIIQVAVAAVLLALYLYGYVSPAEPQNTAPSGLMSLVAYVLNELGIFPEAFFGRDTVWIHIVSGGLGLVLLASLMATIRSRRGPSAKAEIALIGITLFVLGMCVLTAFGRARFGLEQATSGRYVTPVLLFWSALLLLCVSRLPGQGRTWGLGGLGLLTIVIAILEPRLATPAFRFARSLDAAIPAVIVPNGDRALLSRLYPDPDTVTAHLPSLQAANASIFEEPWSRWLNSTFPGGQPPSDLRTCAGTVADVVAVTDGIRSGWRLSGRSSEQVWPARLVFLDPAARVVGVGVGRLDERAAGEPRTTVGAAPDRWLGEINQTDPRSVQAYMLDANDHAVCSFRDQPAMHS